MFAPVTVGSGCIIGERVAIGLREASRNQAEGVIIENKVVIEVGAVIEGRVIGEGTVVEVNAVVGKGAVIGKVWHSFISTSCRKAKDTES